VLASLAMVSATGRAPASLYEIAVTTWTGEVQRLDRFEGQVLLIVNVASRCGFTPQYAGLEALYRRHKDRGFSVLAFPCNQFGRQEPGTEAEIQRFCAGTYAVTFPVFAKIEVNGPGAHPLFAFLKSRKPGLLGAGTIKWNFTKFLVDRSGQVVARFSPATAPEAIEQRITALLG
jgi:glutathione peroxidase